MGMSNAERQKRYRERLKAEAGRAGDSAAVLVDREELEELRALRPLLEGQYRAAGMTLLEAHADEWDGSAALLEEFQAKPLTALDMVEIMQAAGQKAAADMFERWANARVAEAVQRPKNLTKTPDRSKARRRRVT
ncbi:MAG TPA: hypothetical protein VD995_04730 [Azospirillum sp.]|nr:hypothetical protein [Azospirillum sp.]